MADETEAMDNLIAQDADLIDAQPTQIDALLDAEGVKLYWYRQGKDDGVEHERAKIVAYARGHGGNAWSQDVLYFAEKVEAGEHLKEQSK